MSQETTERTASKALHDFDFLTPEQLADLADESKQAEYNRAYEEQQRRRACPECGDS